MSVFESTIESMVEDGVDIDDLVAIDIESDSTVSTSTTTDIDCSEIEAEISELEDELAELLSEEENAECTISESESSSSSTFEEEIFESEYDEIVELEVISQ